MKKPYNDQFDKKRRNFLKVLGAAGVTKGLLQASPLVSGMMYSRMAEAQGGVDKIMTLYIGNGALPNAWHGQPGQLRGFSEPLNAVAGDIMMLDGITAHNPHVGMNLGHGIMKLLMNKQWGGGESFDVNMGHILRAGRRYPYLIGGIHQNWGGGAPEISRDNGGSIGMQQNPFTLFEQVFGAGGGTTPSPGGTNPKLHIVDGHLDAVKALQGKLGQHEKERLDAHLTAISEKEQQIIADSQTDGGMGGDCGSTSTPNAFPLNGDTIREQFRLFTDIFALAMKCNLVASTMLYFGDDSAELSFPGVQVAGQSYGATMHTASHDYQLGRKGDSCCEDYPQWYAQRVEATKLQAYMIQKFKDEGLLDSTLIAQVSDAGHGDLHDPERVPIVIAGGGVGNGSQRTVNGNSHDVWHSLAVKLGADQSSSYQGFSNNQVF